MSGQPWHDQTESSLTGAGEGPRKDPQQGLGLDIDGDWRPVRTVRLGSVLSHRVRRRPSEVRRTTTDARGGSETTMRSGGYRDVEIRSECLETELEKNPTSIFLHQSLPHSQTELAGWVDTGTKAPVVWIYIYYTSNKGI